MTQRLRLYERVWFRMHAHPQTSEPEVFLAYDLTDAIVQSAEAEKRVGNPMSGPRETWVWETRPHIGPDTAPEGRCLHCLSADLASDHCKNCQHYLPGFAPPKAPA